MSTDGVQYGPEVAEIYDAVIAPVIPADNTVDFLREAITGKDVLEIGVGTGRMALPVSQLANSFTGLDNSPAMLEKLRAKDFSGDVTFIQGDFREPFKTDKLFHTAYGAMGSIACTGSRAELVTTLSNIADRLHPGGSVWFDYYVRDMYLQLVEVGYFASEMQNREVELRVSLDEATDILTMDTTVHEPSVASVSFSESVLLISPSEIEQCVVDAGFTPKQYVGGQGAPYDWYVAEIG